MRTLLILLPILLGIVVLFWGTFYLAKKQRVQMRKELEALEENTDPGWDYLFAGLNDDLTNKAKKRRK